MIALRKWRSVLRLIRIDAPLDALNNAALMEPCQCDLDRIWRNTIACGELQQHRARRGVTRLHQCNDFTRKRPDHRGSSCRVNTPMLVILATPRI